ncbi:MAG: hypothetical protein ACE37D_01420 [Pseudomonadales bacterium]|jgi:hypothetical protein
MKKFIALGLLATVVSAQAETPRAMESVVQLSAHQTEILLGDQGEPVRMISSQQAAALLGDDMDLSIHHLNNMPATAAGLEEVVYIDANNAQRLLGE